jgi:hypothetical protein
MTMCMSLSGRNLLVGLLALGWIAPSHELAQMSRIGVSSNSSSYAARSGAIVAKLPPNGGWAEVIAVTPEWLVIQNERGQQLPIEVSRIGTFSIRWPIELDRVALGTMAEVIGRDLGTNQILADQVDLFEGRSANLISPSIERIADSGRRMDVLDLDLRTPDGTGSFRFLQPDDLAAPLRLHVVGPVVSLHPLRIGVQAINPVTVFPGSESFLINSVTPGSPETVHKGDIVYFASIEAMSRSLILGELVVYKKPGLSQSPP